MKFHLLVGSLFLLSTYALADKKEDAKENNGLGKIIVTAPAFWCPFACPAGDKDLGFEPEITIAALAEAGLKVEYKNMPYDRALRQLKTGGIDAITGAFAAEAPFAILPKNILATGKFCFYSKKDDPWEYKSVKDLKGRKFVYASGYAYDADVDKFIKDNPKLAKGIAGDDVMERNGKIVSTGRSQSMIEDIVLFKHFDWATKFNLKNSGCLDSFNKAYLALSPKDKKKSQKIADAFDKGFEKILKNGKIDEILAKYKLDRDTWSSGLHKKSK